MLIFLIVVTSAKPLGDSSEDSWKSDVERLNKMKSNSMEFLTTTFQEVILLMRMATDLAVEYN